MKNEVKMREITANDIGLLFDVASAIGSDEIAKLAEDPSVMSAVARISEGGFRDVGAIVVVKVVAIVIKNYRKCEPALKKLLSTMCGMSAEEIGKCSAGTYAAMLKKVVTSQGVRDFFTELLPSAPAEEASPDSKN